MPLIFRVVFSDGFRKENYDNFVCMEAKGIKYQPSCPKFFVNSSYSFSCFPSTDGLVLFKAERRSSLVIWPISRSTWFLKSSQLFSSPS